MKSVYPVVFAFSLLFLLAPAAISGNTIDDKRTEMTTGGCPWTLSLSAGDLKQEQKDLKPDGKSGYFLYQDAKGMINLSVFIEPVGDCKDSKECRDMVWKLGNPAWENLKNVVQGEIDGNSFLEFLIPTFRGQEIRQQNMYVEFVKDGYWVDLHISKIAYQPKEHEVFEKLVKSVKFEAKPAKQ